MRNLGGVIVIALAAAAPGEAAIRAQGGERTVTVGLARNGEPVDLAAEGWEITASRGGSWPTHSGSRSSQAPNEHQFTVRSEHPLELRISRSVGGADAAGSPRCELKLRTRTIEPEGVTVRIDLTPGPYRGTLFSTRSDPLRGARIAVRRQPGPGMPPEFTEVSALAYATTDQGGRYEVGDLLPGTYEVEIDRTMAGPTAYRHGGREFLPVQMGTFTVAPGGAAEIPASTILWSDRPASIRVLQDSRPSRGARVTAQWVISEPMFWNSAVSGITGEDGAVRFLVPRSAGWLEDIAVEAEEEFSEVLNPLYRAQFTWSDSPGALVVECELPDIRRMGSVQVEIPGLAGLPREVENTTIEWQVTLLPGLGPEMLSNPRAPFLSRKVCAAGEEVSFGPIVPGRYFVTLSGVPQGAVNDPAALFRTIGDRWRRESESFDVPVGSPIRIVLEGNR